MEFLVNNSFFCLFLINGKKEGLLFVYFSYIYIFLPTGRRFRIGKLETEKVIIVMTGLSMVCAFASSFQVLFLICFIVIIISIITLEVAGQKIFLLISY